MKYIALFIFALILGYVSYPMLNPPLQTVIHRSERQTTYRPIETRGHVIGKAPVEDEVEKVRPLNVEVDIQPEKKIEVPVIEKDISNSTDQLTIAEKILADKIDIKTYLAFAEFPTMTAQDSRLIKLNGTFAGKLKSKKESRTGILENITFSVNQDPEKEMTKFEVIDIYDNIHLNAYQLTDQSFKSVPGDENLLMMRVPQGFIVFDIRKFPALSGKIFEMNKMTGDFVLTKSKTKVNQ